MGTFPGWLHFLSWALLRGASEHSCRESSRVAVQKDRAASKGAGDEGFIHCFSCWDASGWELEAEEVFKLWISGAGLCLVIQWRLDCRALRMLWSCLGLVKPMGGAV